MIINLKIETTHLQILESKIFFLNKFCAIFNIFYIKFFNKNKNKKITLLKSPHIHKNTWRTYLLKNYNINYKIKIIQKNHLKNLYILLKILSANSKIKLKIK
jgi:hypothetical protein